MQDSQDQRQIRVYPALWLPFVPRPALGVPTSSEKSSGAQTRAGPLCPGVNKLGANMPLAVGLQFCIEATVY